MRDVGGWPQGSTPIPLCLQKSLEMGGPIPGRTWFKAIKITLHVNAIMNSLYILLHLLTHTHNVHRTWPFISLVRLSSNQNKHRLVHTQQMTLMPAKDFSQSSCKSWARPLHCGLSWEPHTMLLSNLTFQIVKWAANLSGVTGNLSHAQTAVAKTAHFLKWLSTVFFFSWVLYLA